MPQNEVEKFLEDTQQDPNKVDVLDMPLVPEEPAKVEGEGAAEGTDGEGEGDGDLKPRNRRERRLMERLAAERESASFLAGKLEARSEAEKAVSSEEADYLKGIERIYGTDTPEAQLATDLLKKAFVGVHQNAKSEALAEMKAERLREADEMRKADTELDNIVDELEDEYGVTLTKPQQQAYFTLLEKMSPKDKAGEVTEYADPHAVWEVFQEKLKAKPADTRAKDLSSRSMVKSGSSKESNLEQDVHARFLREQGII